MLEINLLGVRHNQGSDPGGACLKIKMYAHPCSIPHNNKSIIMLAHFDSVKLFTVYVPGDCGLDGGLDGACLDGGLDGGLFSGASRGSCSWSC